PALAASGPAESHLSGRALQPGVRLRKAEGVCRSETALGSVCAIGSHGSVGELRAPALHFFEFQGDEIRWNDLRTNSSCNERNKCAAEKSRRRGGKSESSRGGPLRRLSLPGVLLATGLATSACYWLLETTPINMRGKQLCPRNDGGGGGSRNSEPH